MLQLQRLAGNRAVLAALSPNIRLPPMPAQRDAGTAQRGCQRDAIGRDSRAQRQEAASPQLVSSDPLAPWIDRLESAAVTLRVRLDQTQDPELSAHLDSLATAQRELVRIRAEAPPDEQDAAGDDLRTAAVQAAPAFAAGALQEHLSGVASRPSAAVQRLAPAAPVVVAAAAASGPPGWAILAGVAVVVAVVAVVYVATREEPAPTTAPTTGAIPTTGTATRTRTCATEFPGVRECDGLPSEFTFASPQAALNTLKARLRDPSLRLTSPRPSTSGPCPGVGMHYGVMSGGTYIASISCCPCCRDTPAGPVMLTRCRII
jgi:hypothetical protein